MRVGPRKYFNAISFVRVLCCRRKGSDAGKASVETESDKAPPPLPAPDLFDAVAEEWQRLRLAMQDIY